MLAEAVANGLGKKIPDEQLRGKYAPTELRLTTWLVRLLVRSLVFQASQVGFESHTSRFATKDGLADGSAL